MALLLIDDGVIAGGGERNPLIFNLESTPLGDNFYMHGTDGKLYLSYTNNKFNMVRADRLLINKVLASPEPLQNKIQLFRDQNVMIKTNDGSYPCYLYIDVPEQNMVKSYAWLWIIFVILMILLFLIICLFIKFTGPQLPATQDSEQLTYQRPEV